MKTKAILEYAGKTQELEILPQYMQREQRLALPSQYMEARQVAIERDGGLGDVIMLTAAIHQLVEFYPHLSVYYFVNEPFVELFGHDPYIRQCEPRHTLDKRYYDLVLDCKGIVERSRLRAIVDRITLFSLLLTGEAPREGPRLFLRPLTEKEQVEVDGLLDVGRPPRVAIAPFSASLWRDWPYANDLARLVREAGGTPYIIDHREDYIRRVPEAIPAKLTLTQLANFLQRVDCLVSTDTGVYHLAAATRKPPKTVVLFGSVFPPRLRIAWYKDCIGLYDAGIPCLGCEHPRCRPPAPCLTGISAERVAETIGLRAP